MKLRLEGQGKIVAEGSTDSLPPEVLIGRGTQCQWRIPSDYKTVGSRHARLVREGAQFFIEDLNSRNGTFYDERRIAREELRPGRQFSIAGCLQLIVEAEVTLSKVESKGENRLPVSRGARMVGWTSAFRNQSFPVSVSPFIVGAAADATLRISDPLISMHHAEIIRKDDGTYWLRDLNSANGTLVNGRVLNKNESVQIRHRDRLFFAHYGVIFDDGRGLLTERHIWLMGFMVLAAFLVGVAMVRFHIRPTSERVAKKALQLAAAEQFESARQLLLKTSATSRSDDEIGVLRETAGRVEKWNANYQAWGSVTTALAHGDWPGASNALRAVAIDDGDAWNWNGNGLERQREAMSVATLLIAFLELSARAEGSYVSDREAVAALSAALSGTASLAPEYLDPLRSQAESMRQKVQQQIDIGRKFDCLDKLKSWPPPLTDIMGVLEESQRQETGAVRDYVNNLLGGLRALSAELSRYEETRRCLDELRWDCLDNLDRPSSSVPVASVDSRIRAASDRIARRSQIVNEMARLVREVQSLTRGGATTSGFVRVWRDKIALEKVLACDTETLGARDPDRSQSVGEYDRYVGVEDFYDYLY